MISYSSTCYNNVRIILEWEFVSIPSSVNYLTSWPWTSRKALCLAALDYKKEDHQAQ